MLLQTYKIFSKIPNNPPLFTTRNIDITPPTTRPCSLFWGYKS